MTRARLHQKPGKGFGSDVKAEGVQAFRGKRPLLNEPLKGCPLYLGFLIFIVNPPQASSAAKSAIIHPPKSQGWKKPPRAPRLESSTRRRSFAPNCPCEISCDKMCLTTRSVIQSRRRRWRDYRRETRKSAAPNLLQSRRRRLNDSVITSCHSER